MIHSFSSKIKSKSKIKTKTFFGMGALVGLMLFVGCIRSNAEPDAKPSDAKPEGKTSTPSLKPQTTISVVPKEKRDGHDWAQFLGPNRDGISKETGLLKDWSTQKPALVWKKKVGIGYSAPSVIGNRLVLHHRIRNTELVECFRADTGESVWKFSYPTNYRDPFGYNNGPRCSPVLTASHCYTFGAEGVIACLDIKTGKKIWVRETQKDFNIPQAFFGVGATPLLENGKLIVLVGGQPNSGVVAFDEKTGKTIWQHVGKETWEGVPIDDGRKLDGRKLDGKEAEPRKYKWTGKEMLVTYSSPILATIHKKKHLLCLMRQGLVSIDPETGRENFKYWFKSKTHESVHAACPVVVDDTIFLSSAYKVGAALLKVSKDGKSVSEVWRDRKGVATHWATAIYQDGHFYGFSGRHENNATLFCIDAKTGKTKWETSGFDGDASLLNPVTPTRYVNRQTKKELPWVYFGRGSFTLAEGKLIVLGEKATLALVDVNPRKFVEQGRFTPEMLTSPSWVAPVLSRKRLYLRSEKALVCYDLALQKK